MTLGSLFDGAGTVPFAAQILGIETLWSSEIEKFPLEVTAKRFPNVKQLGDVTKIKGDEVEPVDILAFGSPCQDLSVAGRQAGLSGERSGLFMEAIRIIKEMRQATNGRSPTFAIWENVPGAFSSNKGEDFRIVIEEFCKIKDSNADIPRPTDRKGKCTWSDAGGVLGDGYSLAWRVLDAQFWGVPQRRRRIFLVADFRGERAGEILFKRDGLSRNFAESRETWQGITKSLAFRSGIESGAIHREYGISSYNSNAMKSPNPYSGVYEAETARTLDANGGNHTCNQGGIVVLAVDCRNSRLQQPNGTLQAKPTGGTSYNLNNVILTARFGCFGLPLNFRAENTKIYEEVSATLCNGTNPGHHTGTLCFTPCDIILRRLTPTECARLQGMPDWWCDDVPHADSAEYKMWGNGMALPNVLYVLEGIVEAMKE